MFSFQEIKCSQEELWTPEDVIRRAYKEACLTAPVRIFIPPFSRPTIPIPPFSRPTIPRVPHSTTAPTPTLDVTSTWSPATAPTQTSTIYSSQSFGTSPSQGPTLNPTFPPGPDTTPTYETLGPTPFTLSPPVTFLPPNPRSPTPSSPSAETTLPPPSAETTPFSSSPDTSPDTIPSSPSPETTPEYTSAETTQSTTSNGEEIETTASPEITTPPLPETTTSASPSPETSPSQGTTLNPTFSPGPETTTYETLGPETSTETSQPTPETTTETTQPTSETTAETSQPSPGTTAETTAETAPPTPDTTTTTGEIDFLCPATHTRIIGSGSEVISEAVPTGEAQHACSCKCNFQWCKSEPICKKEWCEDTACTVWSYHFLSGKCSLFNKEIKKKGQDYVDDVGYISGLRICVRGNACCLN